MFGVFCESRSGVGRSRGVLGRFRSYTPPIAYLDELCHFCLLRLLFLYAFWTCLDWTILTTK